MPKRTETPAWQRFCAAMVEHGHGRAADIQAASAQRQPRGKKEDGSKVAAKERPSARLLLEQLIPYLYDRFPAF
ncbi:hypothetical protein [Parasphingopyxis lamellibrachiae]|uniref:Uncharacterized protein n=1 Tax=Parasphingopyxis lamellibrachiae TaxID=680125 RepID=A0A3D9FBD2_9SPHN|nr:hypothetical protein [Parasphingopyxis lamellibrachiae]RED15139.1 hypothetical protein DFR46_0126 [Parasphingopyxis lamellibrachiae]